MKRQKRNLQSSYLNILGGSLGMATYLYGPGSAGTHKSVITLKDLYWIRPGLFFLDIFAMSATYPTQAHHQHQSILSPRALSYHKNDITLSGLEPRNQTIDNNPLDIEESEDSEKKGLRKSRPSEQDSSVVQEPLECPPMIVENLLIRFLSHTLCAISLWPSRNL